MRFLRHLAAVVVLVAVVVLAGLAWNHFAGGGLPGEAQATGKRSIAPGRGPGIVVLQPGAKAGPGGPHGPVVVHPGPMNLGLSSMLDPVNLAVLRHTVVIEAVVIALVVMIDVSRRLWRQERRAREVTGRAPARRR